jgi:prolyl-tRNA synthetase
MKFTQLFTKTSNQTPSDEATQNAQLLLKAGFIHKTMAGSYSFLPLGHRVLSKISEIIKIKMDAIGGQQTTLSMLHPAELWQTTGGWDSIDVLFKIKSRTEKDYAIGQSEEEVITPIIKEFVRSYKDLPIMPYQIHWKFRDELRAKSGVMRGREFLMKDMYSLHINQEEFNKFFEIAKTAYLDIFAQMGLVAKATEASGGSFSQKISYEFMVITDAGEDDILYSENSSYCVNTEITELKEGDMAPDGSGVLKLAKASEVGNVFDLGTRYQDCFNFSFLDEFGVAQKGVMGCYGIGVSRLLGVIVEKHSDNKGIVWPMSVAPYHLHLVSLDKDGVVETKAQEIYDQLWQNGVEVLWDNRSEVSAGVKFADSDLIGCPIRLVVSDRSIEAGGVEMKMRNEETSQIVELDNILKEVESKVNEIKNPIKL